MLIVSEEVDSVNEISKYVAFECGKYHQSKSAKRVVKIIILLTIVFVFRGIGYKMVITLTSTPPNFSHNIYNKITCMKEY